ncbi:ATP-binding protein [Hydrogenophaga intermedia]|uniref:ATP-binding protein n=1 Tax=Hydrogenophaga intermedia TaxID=65786 RepID=UPI00204443D9|nr:ATP-binding protein [Hydrogenophaga intermedia]MCM3562569.1 ATP-binding protein [Hydrogenophaga intermedia]
MRWLGRRPAGLGAWLALAFIVLSMALTAALTWFIGHAAIGQLRSTIGVNLAELATQTASRLDRSMYERHREVRLMAARLGDVTDPARVRRELDTLQTSYPLYSWIGLTDDRGTVLTATGGLLEGVDVSGRPWFINAQRGQAMGDVHEAVLLARLLGNEGEAPPRFVDIAFTMSNADGSPRGVLAAHLNWSWARDVERAIFQPLDATRAITPLIVSRDNRVLLGPADLLGTALDLPSLRQAAMASGKATGHTEESWPDGHRYLVGYASDRGLDDYPGMGWRVLVRQRLDEAYSPASALQRQLLVAGLLAALVFSVLGWWVARWISRPLRALTTSAGQLQQGQPVRVPVSNHYEEVAQLGQALNALVYRLQANEVQLLELNANLERRVNDRTQELRKAFEQVKSNEQRIETLVELAQDPFVTMDFFGRITDWNSAAEQLLGWKSEDVIGRPLEEIIIPARYRGQMQAALAHYLQTREAPFVGQRLERLIIDNQGREIPVEMRIGLIDNPPVQLFSAFLHDIRERQEIERLKKEFVSTVSHELRTPLTAMYGSLNLMATGMAGELPADARELVQLANDSCERLIRLINELLDIEKMDAGNMQYDMRRQPIEPLVMRAVRDTMAYASHYGVELRFLAGADAMVDVDGDRIVQVVVNLLSNATKYSPRGGMVDVSIKVRSGHVRVSVLDQGPGVPEAFRARIFERFAQADGSDRRQKGGTGLGLAICRSIMVAHGGRIDFTSEPGRTEFFFELPLA